MSEGGASECVFLAVRVPSHSDSTCLQDSRAHQSLRARYSEVKAIAQTRDEWGVEMGWWSGQAEGHAGIDFPMHMFSTCRRRRFRFVSSLLPALPGPVTPSPAAKDPSAPSARPDSHLLRRVSDPLLGLPCHLFPNN